MSGGSDEDPSVDPVCRLSGLDKKSRSHFGVSAGVGAGEGGMGLTAAC